ncbi:hypothetical protein Q7Q91_08920 [Lactiplantibacillus pentosus]|uniref:hypothetical protein n=1 Tax=Lactiplantibacillus pentosus TaxID=1589 RepID=UPI0027067012|nr:hypothetical protein [Lactiplantibacillus pentosus]MDO7805100.1 hypothetical protein [Lactiplantibacillus pentosus]
MAWTQFFESKDNETRGNMATFKSIWAGFKASPEYQPLKTQYDQMDGVSDIIGMSWDNLSETVGNQLDAALSDYIGKSHADWTAASIGAYLTQVKHDDDIDGTQFLVEGPVVIGEPYCTYLARTKQINAKPDEISKVMAEIKKESPEAGSLPKFLLALFSTPVETEGFMDDDDDFDDDDFDDVDFWDNPDLDSDDDFVPSVDLDQDGSSMTEDDFDDDPSTRVNRDPKLPMWQPSRLLRVNLQYSRLMKIYQERPEWQNRPEVVTADFMQNVVETLLVIGYNRYRKLPRSWTKHMLVEIMTGDFVADRLYSQEEYAAIGPMLTDLISIAGSEQMMKPNKVAQLQRYIQVAAAKMVDAAKNPNNYTVDKKMILKIQAAGVDLDDDDSINNYVTDHRNDIISEYENGFPITAAVFDDQEQLAKLIDFYSPDQERDYLNPDAHVETFEGRSWHRKDAIKAHRFAVELGFRAYLDQQQKHPENTARVSDYVASFEFYLGRAYDCNLLQPEELTAEALEETMSLEYGPNSVVDDPEQQKAVQRIQLDDIDKLMVMVDMLEMYTTLPEQRAQALRQVVRDEKLRLHKRLGMDATPAFRKKKKRKRPKKNRRNKR